MKVKTILVTQISALIISCGNADTNQAQRDSETATHSVRANEDEIGDTNKGTYLHFKKIEEVLAYSDYEIMFVSEIFYPSWVLLDNGILDMSFNVSEGASFSYKCDNNKIHVYYEKNAIFDSTNPPSVGELILDMTLVNDSIFSVQYYHEAWIEKINSKYLNNKVSKDPFPTIYYCVVP